MSAENKNEWIHCNSCGRSTEHLLVHGHRNQEFVEEVKDDYGRTFTTIDGFHDWQLLECQGCKTVCLRSREYFSEWCDPWDSDPYKKEFFPPRTIGSRPKPEWFEMFASLEDLQGHFILTSYAQIYELIQAEHHLAALLTARALLETVAIENGSGDKRSFEEKLTELKNKEFISGKQIIFINQAIYDAGSAAMHRSYNPSKEAVRYVLDVIEKLLHTIYIEPIIENHLSQAKPKKKRAN